MSLHGCRHDILGHYLKAIGLLRVLAKCADAAHRDPDAEGWWNSSQACFCLRSPKYPTREKLVEFFVTHFRPTPVFAAWNKEPGSNASDSEKLGVRGDWEIANRLSAQVVSTQDRRKPANRDKLIALEALEAYRDAAALTVAEAVDAIAAPFLKSNTEHPLFLSKGIAGRAHLWRTHWEYLASFHKHRAAYAKAVERMSAHKGTARQLVKLKEKVDAALQSITEWLPFEEGFASAAKGKGTPFFPDAINAAMETATRETTPYHCLDLLSTIFHACRQMAISQSFRDTLPGKRARFFRPLPMEDWSGLLDALAHYDPEDPRLGAEFCIARAAASIEGRMKQRGGTHSEVLPMLGSLLPLKLGPGGWFLPANGDPSHQAVWTGTDVRHDLAAVLARRYRDSLTDDRPTLIASHVSLGARLSDVLSFLRHELDDHLIARWIEALSLIGWKYIKPANTPADGEMESHAIPLEYAALRTLIELECERREGSDTKKRRSQQPISLLCLRSGSTLPLSVTESLRWIAIWGVPNPDREQAKDGKARLAGRDIIYLASISPSSDAARLAASVCIPLHWRDRNALYRAVSLLQ